MTTPELERPTLAPDALEARLARLAPDQRAAATADPGPVLCVAPAGSGKTTTVVARIAWRVAKGADPATVCALTFNRRAAEELEARADDALAELGILRDAVRVRTFHALGREILADGGFDVTRIVDRASVLDRLAATPLSAAAHRWLDEAFTRLKLDPERAPPPDDVETHAAFTAYVAELARDDALDLDDLVARASPALDADDALLDRWQARCRVLFVDEAQDLDRAQLELALRLTGERRDIFLVGDDDQTIYAWRLADVRRVLGLAARLPGLTRIDLETNHRCAPEIVHRAARLVAHNRERFDKVIRASPMASGELRLAPDGGDEVARARRLLPAWLDLDAGSHAVLARTNRELATYAAVAREMDTPIEVEDDGLRVDDPWVDAILASALELQAAAPRHPLLALREAADRVAAPDDVAAWVLAWAAPYRDLDAFGIVLDGRRAEADLADEGDRLSLATVHGTKGLEWDHVLCIGFDEGRFPSARTLRESPSPGRALEEERRLAYVAWTRARRTLTILHDPWAPSVFLREAFDPRELSLPEPAVTGSSSWRRDRDA